MKIREYGAGDMPAMRALWQRTFDESDAYLDTFFALLPDCGSAVVGFTDEGLVAAAYAMTGYELLRGNERAQCGYVYAVAVDEGARGNGFGAEITKAAAALCRERESKIVATLPADAPLYGFYEKQIGTKHLLHTVSRAVRAEDTMPVMELSTTEYMLWRENMLRGRAHVRLSYPMLELQRAMCRAYGGGLYCSAEGLFAAYREGGTLCIRELLCPEGEEDRNAAAAAHALGCENAVYRLASAEGERYIAADAAMGAETVWNLTLD